MPGAEEQLGDAALIVDPDDPAAVADAIQRVGQKPERNPLVEAGHVAGRLINPPMTTSVACSPFSTGFEQERRLWA